MGFMYTMSGTDKKSGYVLGSAEFLFFCAYAGSAFVAAYLKERGYSPAAVGVLLALVNCAGVVASPVMGTLSDRLGSSRRVLMLCVAVESVLLLFLPVALALPQALLAALLLVWSFFRNPTPGLADSWIVLQ